MRSRVFLLSPACCSGKRAALLLHERADFYLARKLQSAGASLGEVFSFLSGLYFRGKLTYARAFAAPGTNPGRIHVITAGRGLLGPDTNITVEDLRAFAAVPIDAFEPRYTQPLARDAAVLATHLAPSGQAVLLGSIATDKYVAPLQPAFGGRLVFPGAFVGRGDMSRGGLLLRAVEEGTELDYTPVSASPYKYTRRL